MISLSQWLGQRVPSRGASVSKAFDWEIGGWVARLRSFDDALSPNDLAFQLLKDSRSGEEYALWRLLNRRLGLGLNNL